MKNKSSNSQKLMQFLDDIMLFLLAKCEFDG